MHIFFIGIGSDRSSDVGLMDVDEEVAEEVAMDDEQVAMDADEQAEVEMGADERVAIVGNRMDNNAPQHIDDEEDGPVDGPRIQAYVRLARTIRTYYESMTINILIYSILLLQNASMHAAWICWPRRYSFHNFRSLSAAFYTTSYIQKALQAL